MLNKPLSKILLGVLLKVAMDFVSEANDQRKQTTLRETQRANEINVDKLSMNDKHKIQRGDGNMDYEKEADGFGPGLLLGSLMGGVIGAGLALWYAPQAGKKTQALLKHEATRLQKQVSKRANNLYDTVEDMAKETAERANELTEHGREFVEEKASTLKKVMGR